MSLGQLRGGKRAVRIKRVKEPLLLTLCGASCSAPEELERTNGEKVSVGPNRTTSKSREELEPHMVLDSELYEGIVSQTIIEPKVGFVDPSWRYGLLGSLMVLGS